MIADYINCTFKAGQRYHQSVVTRRRKPETNRYICASSYGDPLTYRTTLSRHYRKRMCSLSVRLFVALCRPGSLCKFKASKSARLVSLSSSQHERSRLGTHGGEIGMRIHTVKKGAIPQVIDIASFNYHLVRGLLFSYGDFAVAVTAVNRSAASGLKGHFGTLPALSTDHGIHLARGRLRVAAVAVANITLLLFSCLTAWRTALGLIGVAFCSEELLLFYGEIKRGTAIEANDGFFLKTHMDDLLFNIWWVLVIQSLS